MEAEFFQALAIGGDVGVWALIYFLWKLERRVFVLEGKLLS